uniref:Protein kinase domain-containing protein n=1 Tax=Setaria italica TaxID=4555 RepID=K4AI74_SETIT
MNVVFGVLLFFLTGLIVRPCPAAADVYCDNLRQVAAALPRNTSSSPLHFATAIVGHAPDAVYALAFCRGDVLNDTACGECVASTFDRIFNVTGGQCYAWDGYYGDCHVFYSSDNIVVFPSNATEQNDETPFERWNIKNVTGSAGDVRLIAGLIHELVVETVEAAASAAPRRFATGAMDSGTTFPTIRHVTISGRMSKLWAIPIVAVPLAAAAFLYFIFYSPWLRKYRKGSQELQGEELVWDGKNSEFSVFDFEQVLEATNQFSEENKLGQGGFGAVYKGLFSDGQEIAVKRLASHSGQGFTEFKNEVQLIAKLQHMNLVRLLGCCSQEDEKILVYEYLPNKSLDFFIFDENKRALLDWSKLLAIIVGIAHGLLYLHKHSRLRVIHRDLKPSNILLDSEMNPKISDFGLAKIFSSTNTQANTTRRVVGTYGYMAPEYASEGIFSIKSDVFSFGVLVLEILSGKRNSGSHQCGDFINLIGYAWQLWEEGRWIDLVDASLTPTSHSTEMMRCTKLHCYVVAMLGSETTIIAEPKQPAYFNVRVGNEEALTATESCSINDVTISVTTPR